MRGARPLAAALGAFAASCSSPGSAPPGPDANTAYTQSTSTGTSTTTTAAADAGARSFRDGLDFDGDGKPDRVDVDFTGGAHCCYRVAVTIGGDRRFDLPFEIDGGYVGGLDLSRPDRFDAAVGPDGRAELRMEIATYNGEPQPIPREWTARFGVRSHRVAVRFDASGPHVTNLGWRCRDAVQVVKLRRWAAWEGLPADCELSKVQDQLGSPVTSGAKGSWVLSATPDLDLAALSRTLGEAPVEVDVQGSSGLRDRVWPARGLAVRVSREGRPVSLLLFPASDLDRYRRDFAPPAPR